MKKFLLCVLAAICLAFAASCKNSNLPDGTANGKGNGNVPPNAAEDPFPPQDDNDQSDENENDDSGNTENRDDKDKGWSPWVK